MNSGTMIIGIDTRIVEKNAKKIRSRPGNSSRARAKADIEWKAIETTVTTVASRRLLPRQRTKGAVANTDRKFSQVGSAGIGLPPDTASAGPRGLAVISRLGAAVRSGRGSGAAR